MACEEWDEDELFDSCRRAWPYRDLSRQTSTRSSTMLSEGIAPRNRARRVPASRSDQRPAAGPPRRRGSRRITSGGAIPETADYRVVTEHDGTFVGTVDEDFAVESLAGDVFLLGNTSWRMRYVRGGEVVVSDAEGAAATIPFWLGEAPGRTIESVARSVAPARGHRPGRVLIRPQLPLAEHRNGAPNPT